MKKYAITLVLTLTLCVGFVGGAIASNGLEKITANLNHNIKFIANNSSWTPKDQSGKKLVPISYKGTTYVPVRAVSEVLNTPIDWDAETSTIYINSKKPDKVSSNNSSFKPPAAFSSFVLGESEATVTKSETRKFIQKQESIVGDYDFELVYSVDGSKSFPPAKLYYYFKNKTLVEYDYYFDTNSFTEAYEAFMVAQALLNATYYKPSESELIWNVSQSNIDAYYSVYKNDYLNMLKAAMARKDLHLARYYHFEKHTVVILMSNIGTASQPDFFTVIGVQKK